MPAQLGESVTFVFDFTVAGVPTSGLSPAPLITIYSPAGVALVSAAAMTEQVTPARYVYAYTLPNVAGLYEARAFSSQANLDSQYMSCGLEVGQTWIQDLDAAISAIPTAVWAAGTRTLTSFGTLIADVWSYATRILTAGTNIALAKGVGLTGLNDISTTQVHTEVVNALASDTYSEPSAPPAATASLVSKISWIEVMARNKLSETNALQSVYADDDSTVIATAVITDDGSTTVREKMTP